MTPQNNIIPFPRAKAPAAQQPLRSDGIPLRVGDAVLIDSNARQHEGWITGYGQPEPLTGFRAYSIFCTDGVHRMAQATAVSSLH